MARRPTQHTLDEIASGSHVNDQIEVTCDRVYSAGNVRAQTVDHATGHRTETTRALVVCEQGALAMPIASDLEMPAEELVRSGRVRAATTNDRDWYPTTSSSATMIRYYLAPPTPPPTFYLLAAIGMPLVCAGIVGKGYRDSRRARRMT